MSNYFDDLSARLTGGQSTIRLGVTGLSRAGKTVFITSLVANLLERERMVLLQAEAEGRIEVARLGEQPDPTLARFEFEKHLAKLLAEPPSWPESTRHISEIRISFRIARRGFGTIFGDRKTVHLDIVDYPGEWLLDLGLIDQTYDTWSQNILSELEKKPIGKTGEFLEKLNSMDPKKRYSEMQSAELADIFTEAIRERHAMGYNDLVPGRLLLPAELEGAPVVTFAPLRAEGGSRKSLHHLFAGRFDSYKKQVVRPFFRNHFARIDRQVVLVDVLGALENGQKAIRSLENAMTDILKAFKPGKNHFLAMLFGAKVDKIAFVATKADLVHHYQHEKMVDLTRTILKNAERHALYAGAKTSAKAVASLRATVEEKAKHDGRDLAIVRGYREGDRKSVGFHFGELPTDAQAFVMGENDGKFNAPNLAPPKLNQRSKAGLPHIRLDQLVEFLIGDKLR